MIKHPSLMYSIYKFTSRKTHPPFPVSSADIQCVLEKILNGACRVTKTKACMSFGAATMKMHSLRMFPLIHIVKAFHPTLQQLLSLQYRSLVK